MTSLPASPSKSIARRIRVSLGQGCLRHLPFAATVAAEREWRRSGLVFAIADRGDINELIAVKGSDSQ